MSGRTQRRNAHVRTSTLDVEIAALERRARECSPSSPERPALFNALAIWLRRRSAETGSAVDLDRALAAAETAAAADPAGAVEAAYLNTLGNVLVDRHATTARGEGIDRAVAAYERAVDGARDADDRRAFTANLASALADRYRYGGLSADLDRAIDLVERTPREVMRDPVEQAGVAVNLASMLQDRYAARGSIDDLDSAVRVAGSALADAPTGSETRLRLRTNLGGALLSRYDRSRDPSELAAALGELTAGRDEAPMVASGRAPLLNNLGIAYGARARATVGRERRSDLDRSVKAHRDAVATAPLADRPQYASGLASALLDRYQQTWDRRDLGEAARTWRQALRRTPAQSPAYSRRLGNLARAAALDFDRTGRPWTLLRARRRYGRSCRTGLETDPESSLFVAIDWGDWARRRGSAREAAGAYDRAGMALDRLFRSQVLRAHKEDWLRAAAGVANEGAWVHVASHRVPAAVMALERGRAHLLSEALEHGRADLERLDAAGRGDLAAQFERAVSRLAALEGGR